jgi:hypothetical protein
MGWILERLKVTEHCYRGNPSGPWDTHVTILPTLPQSISQNNHHPLPCPQPFPLVLRTQQVSSTPANATSSVSPMFSSPTPAQGSRNLAAKTLMAAGLVDRDTRMRDASDHPGGRKGSSKIRSHRPRPIDLVKDQPGPSRISTVNILLIYLVISSSRRTRLASLFSEINQTYVVHPEYSAKACYSDCTLL